MCSMHASITEGAFKIVALRLWSTRTFAEDSDAVISLHFPATSFLT